MIPSQWPPSPTGQGFSLTQGEPKNFAMMSTRAPGGAYSQENLVRSQLANEKQIAELNNATSRYGIDAPLAFKREMFGNIWPYAQKMLENPFGAFSGSITGGANVGGVPAPNISTQDLINPMQTRMLMNNANAGVVQRNQSQARAEREKSAGSGFTTTSPAYAELQNARDMGANIEQSQNALKFPLQTQQANADYRRSGEALQGQQYASLLRAMSDMYGSNLNYAGNVQGALLRSLIG
jgi:hypothetical protein